MARAKSPSGNPAPASASHPYAARSRQCTCSHASQAPASAAHPACPLSAPSCPQGGDEVAAVGG